MQFNIFVECGDSSSPDLIACPSPNARGEFFCISEEYLCDKRMDCPNGEDEDLVSCMFHQWVSLRFLTLSTKYPLKGNDVCLISSESYFSYFVFICKLSFES